MNFRVFNDNITEAKFEEFFAKTGLIAGVGRGGSGVFLVNGGSVIDRGEISGAKAASGDVGGEGVGGGGHGARVAA